MRVGGGSAACLWQVVNGFNSVIDKPGSKRNPPMTADLILKSLNITDTNTLLEQNVFSIRKLFVQL